MGPLIDFLVSRQVISGFIGGLLGVGNVIAIVWLTKRFLTKKSLALSFLVIVIKWSIVLAVTYRVLTDKVSFDGLWFVLGFGVSLPFAIGISWIIQSGSNEQKGD